ncbi:MAG: hypothetical protein L3K03_00295 [Thermoplasmata archaeon]|nr:hypothetical protein [Thermoplasmata archaeon]
MHRAGFPIVVLPFPGRRTPSWWDAPWDWPPACRPSRPRPTASRALTLCTNWGVTATPAHPGPLGHAGPWAPAVDSIESAYGTENVVHVSFEEFGRTFSSRRQEFERYREGGWPVRRIQQKLRSASGQRGIRNAHEAYARYRGFARPNVLHLYPSFQPAPGFRREFPEALECGPFRPDISREHAYRPRGRAGRTPVWFWHASPGSSARLAQALDPVVEALGTQLILEYRGDPWEHDPSSNAIEWRRLEHLPAPEFRRRFRAADLRIVTGSRTLLEALWIGGPFLYFHGVLNSGAHLRRHRPEKLEALLRLWKSQGVSPEVAHDLASFSRLRNLHPIVRRALEDRRWASAFRRRPISRGFSAPWHEAGELLEAIAHGWVEGRRSAPAWVQEVRSGRLRADAVGPNRSRRPA